MLRIRELSTQRSMRSVFDGGNSHGAKRSVWIYVLVFTFVYCIFEPQGVDAQFTCPTNCTCVDFRVSGVKYKNVTCDAAGYNSVPSDGKEGSDVIKLVLTNNQIASLTSTDFQYFTNLAELDISYNPISSIAADTFSNLTSLQILNLAGNDLTSLPSGIFDDSNITHLNISASTQMDVTLNLAPSQILTVLDLSHNSIASLPIGLFDQMTSLLEVYLNDNLLTTVESNTFTSTTITKVDLSSNLIDTATDSFDSDVLLSVDLSNNVISTISSQFLNSASVQSLDLSHNQLDELDKKEFKNAATLVSLDLSSNIIASVHRESFKDLVNLVNLNLSHNQIDELDDRTFDDTEALISLDLSNNQLTSLDADLFNECPALQIVHLENNAITSIPTAIFSQTTNLRSIYLSGNSLTTLDTSVFNNLGTFSVDISDNSFTCDCTLRDNLYELYWHVDKTILNEDQVRCIDTGTENVFLDWDDPNCSGNLGSTCTATNNCMARNSNCSANVCMCMDSYYDNNDDSTDGGECHAKVRLDYPCNLDAGCLTSNAYCSNSVCKCESDHYDTSPIYLGGDCNPKLGLGGTCQWDEMCITSNGYCNLSTYICECTSQYYDSNNSTVADGECLPKISLNNPCNATYQCAPTNSECTGNQCVCAQGYYDFDDSGVCRDPSAFYSCFPFTNSEEEVHFAHSGDYSTNTACLEFCFERQSSFYMIENGTCLCGDASTTSSCCPLVMTDCGSRTHVGNSVSSVTAGINVTSIPQLKVGEAHTFTVISNLSIIDRTIWNFGDGTTLNITGKTSTVQHTFTHAALFNVTVSACKVSIDVCEDVEIPVKVQVPPENLTTWITGVNEADAADSLADIYATFTMGYYFEYYWEKENTSSSTKTKKRGCESSWTTHRERCIKLITSTADFTTASSACSTTYGGTLLKINFNAEISEIGTALSASSLLLIGAQKSGDVWQWTSDSSQTFFWTDDLTDASAGDCVVINPSTNSLTSAACTAANQYVCMKDPVDCPKGGTLQSDGYCLVLASDVSIPGKSWSDANAYCWSYFGGWLANITSSTRQTAVVSQLTTSSVSEAWFGLSDADTEGYYKWADQSSYNYQSPPYKPTVTEDLYDCMVVTSSSTWKSYECDLIKDFVCQYSENIEKVNVESYLLGTPDIGITQGQDLQQVVAVDTFTDTTINTDVYLFPGHLITKAGKLRSWIFHSVNVGASDSYDISMQVLRPSCSNNLVRPGCDGTRFSTCSNSNPSCSTVTCNTNQYPCYLSNTCKLYNESCSCESESSSTWATAACTSDGTSPTYTVIGHTQITVSISGENFYTVPAGDFSVQPYDVLGLQFPAGANLIKCEAVAGSNSQQKVYKSSNAGWLAKTDPFPMTGKTDEELTCYFHVIYTEDVIKNLTQNLAYSSEVGNYKLSVSIVDTDTRELTIDLEESIEDVSLIYPVPVSSITPASTDDLGTVYTALNDAIDYTVRVERGTELSAVWSFDTAQTISFSSSCPTAVSALLSQDCNEALFWSSNPYATFNHAITTTGTSTLEITISNSLHSVMKTVTIYTEETVSGVALSLDTATYTTNTVQVNTIADFSTTVTQGTGLTYTYTIDGTEMASSSSASFAYTFNTEGTFQVVVNVSNIVSSATSTLSIIVEISAQFSGCQFKNIPYIAATNIALELQVECTVQVGADIQASWLFSAGASNSTSGVVVSSGTTIILTTNVTFVTALSSVTTTTILEDPFEAVSINTYIVIYNAIPSTSLVVSSQAISPGSSVDFTPSVPTSPGNYGTVNFTLEYGDGSSTAVSQGASNTYTYSTAGNYTVTITATNGPSSVSFTSYVTVYETITSCSLSYDGPKEMGTSALFTATASSGNFIEYNFKSTSVFDVTQSANTYSYTFSTANDYDVSVICSNALSSASGSVTANILDTTEIRLQSVKMNNNGISGCIESDVSNQFSVDVVHYDSSSLTYDWDWGDMGAVTIASTATQNKVYTATGDMTITITAKYAAASAQQSITQAVCVQARITAPTIVVNSPYGLPASSTADVDITASVTTGTSLSYSWTSDATMLSSATSQTLQIRLTAEGTYNIGVTLSNAINSETTSMILTVIQVISGLNIECSTATLLSGQLYVQKSASNTYSGSVTTGSGVSYSWDFGDSSAGATGSSASHSYSAVGTYTITLTASNSVTSPNVVATITVNVEEAISSVNLLHWLSQWLNNKIATVSERNLDITNQAVFKADVMPSGMALTYYWQFDSSLTTETTTTNLGYHTYTTTGLKTCTVTAVNTLGNMTASLDFYAIERITSIEVHEGSNLLSESQNFPVGLNQEYSFTVSSSQIVDNTAEYIIRIKQPSGTLVKSSLISVLNVTLTNTMDYTMEVNVENSINAHTVTYILEVIESVSGPSITSSISSGTGDGGNITLGSTIQLTGSAAVGTYLEYSWSYAEAPAGESIPSTSNNESLTLTPGTVGTYIVTLSISNPVSSAISVNYTVAVLVGVSGVSIGDSLTYTGAAVAGSSNTFTAVVAAGTQRSYAWTAFKSGTANRYGSDPTFTVTFSDQVLYNITLEVSNDASSELAFMEVYSLYQIGSFILDVNGATLETSINKYVAKTGDSITFNSTISFTTFVTFTWTIDGAQIATGQTLDHTFTSAASYTVKLDAVNLISSYSSQLELLAQDGVTGLAVSNCGGTYLLETSISMVVTYTTGTDVSTAWTGQGLSTTSGTSVTAYYTATGVYNITVTSSNYVSSQSQNCPITIQGRIDNLQLTASEYKFADYAITFNLTGDNLVAGDVTYTWTFSNGVVTTTSVSTLDHTFTAAGTYTLTAEASNAVSSATATISVDVTSLACQEPVLAVDGPSERTTVRARHIELAVSVDNKGCNSYTSVNTWTVYTASSCADSLTTQYSLSSSILTTSPTLQLPAATLPYDSYCVVFQSGYQNTPVIKSKYFNVTISKSDLVALLFGGDEGIRVTGTELTLNASSSYDPDQVEPSLLFSWTCTPTVSTTTSDAVCSAVSALTTSAATLTGLTLNVGDIFTIQVTASATGRTSGTATQKITIYGAATPVLAASCISCSANDNYFISSSKWVVIKGSCTSGCTSATTYAWTVTDTSGNTVTVDSAFTTTGTNQINLVIKSGLLSDATGYTFRLSATEAGNTGFALFTLQPSTFPQSGTCSVTVAAARVVPLQDLVTVTCQNWQDADQMSGIYYKIVASSSTTSDEHIVYYGTRAVNSVSISPFGGTSYADVQVKVYVMNDYGSKTFAVSQTISYEAPTLTSSQADNVDYIVDQIVGNMVTITNTNNPVLLVQYAIAVLHFLNEQSATGVGAREARTAVRELIANSLSGIPPGSLSDKQQKASAMKYLSWYSDELSSNTLSLLSSEIEQQAAEFESIVQQGSDQADIKPDNLLYANTQLQTALQSSSIPTSNATVMAEFGSLDQYKLGISQSYSITTYASEQAMKQAMIVKSITFSTQLLYVQLKATLPGEAATTKTMSDGSEYTALHVFVDSIQQNFNKGSISVSFPENIISQTSYTDDSIFQVVLVNENNQLNFGTNVYPLNAKSVFSTFASTDGTTVPVSNLPDDSLITMYMFRDDVTPYTIDDTGIINSSGYDPTDGAIYSTYTLKAGKTTQVPLTRPQESDTAVGVYIRPNYDSSGELTARLFLGSYEFTDSETDVNLRPKTITNTMMANSQHDHRDYTFFMSNVQTSDAYRLRITSATEVQVNISISYYKCNYFHEQDNVWKSDGCAPTEMSIPTVMECECNHMTSYGGSLLVSPDDLDFTDLTDVDFASNPVAIITCSVVLFVYIVSVIACRRMDLLDIKRISNIPLCGKDGSFKYEITTVTGRLPRAGTSAHVGIRLFGEYGKSVRQHISKQGAFQRNCSDTFVVAYDVNLGELKKIMIWHDNSGLSPSWYLSHVIIHDLQTFQKYYFFAHSWLSLEQENGSIQREINVAGAKEMSRFGYRMKTAAFNALADKHLWMSLMNRPAQSCFTRVQRATVCVTLMFCFICINAMWYGLLKKDNTDISWGTFGWEEIVLAIVTNVMVFPISIAIMFLFKKSRPKANMLERLQKPQTAQTIEIENLCDNSHGGSFESHNTGEVPYDIERESTMDSVPQTAVALHRSKHVMKSHRENTDDTLGARPRVAVTSSSAKSPLWNQDNIMKWPEAVPYNDADSRPSTSSTMEPSMRQQPSKAGGATKGYVKGKSIKSKEATQQLLDELDILEQELKESESKSVRSSGSKRSVISSRKASLRKASWGSLEDILNSDDESVAESGKNSRRNSKRHSVATPNGKKFNPRADPRINGNGAHWPKSRESMTSAGQGDNFDQSTSGAITGGIRPGYYSEMTMESRDIRPIPMPKEKCSLPHWCIYIAYVICFLLCVFSTIIVILYCFQFGPEESTEWVLAFILSLVLSLLVIEPLKALLIALYIVAAYKSVEQDEDDDSIAIEHSFDNSNEKLKDVKFKPVSGFALLQAKEEGRKIHRMNVMLRQFIAYIFYLWVLMVICYINFNQDTYLLNKYINNTFIETTTSNYVGYKNITSIEEFWDWSENVLTDSLHLKDSSTDEEHGYLLGTARWRLIRSVTETCFATDAASSLGASVLTDRTCYGDNGFHEDTAEYGERWNDSLYNKSWRHSTGSQLGGSHKVGYVDTYGGGGYTQELGTSQAQTLTIIQDLKYKGFIDLRTRAIVTEFAMYSPGTDMTVMVAMLAEFPLSGGVLTSYEIQSQRLLWFQENRVDPLMVMECILLLVVIYSLVHITLQIRDKKIKFFKDVWNWYEMLTTLMTTVSIGIYIGCVAEATSAFNTYLDNQSGFTNFERTAYVHIAMRYLHAWLLFLLMFKVVKQLRFIKFMHVYERTLSTAAGHLLGTGLIYGILLLVYAQLGYLMYGRFVSGFETFWLSISTLVVMIRGTFDFWPMLDYHPVFSHFYVYSYYAFTYGIMIALVISVLNSTYRVVKSQMYYKSTLEMQDYEMIDFMLKRFKLWAGFTKPKPAFRSVRFPGLPSVSSRSSSSLSNRTTSSIESSHSVLGPEFSRIQLNSMMVRLAPTWQAVLRRFEKIEALEKEEENLVKKAEDTMKDLNLRCRINEFERQRKEILNWQKPSSSVSPPVESSRQRQSVVKRPPNRDNQTERKAPATVTGATTRSAVTPNGKDDKLPQGKRPLSDQGGRADQLTKQDSVRDKERKFFKSVKPSKAAWNK